MWSSRETLSMEKDGRGMPYTRIYLLSLYSQLSGILTVLQAVLHGARNCANAWMKLEQGLFCRLASTHSRMCSSNSPLYTTQFWLRLRTYVRLRNDVPRVKQLFHTLTRNFSTTRFKIRSRPCHPLWFPVSWIITFDISTSHKQTHCDPNLYSRYSQSPIKIQVIDIFIDKYTVKL